MGATMSREEHLEAALRVILDCADYTNDACRPNEMVGAVMAPHVLVNAKRALGLPKWAPILPQPHRVSS